MSILLKEQDRLAGLQVLKSIAQTFLLPGVTPDQERDLVALFERLWADSRPMLVSCRVETREELGTVEFHLSINHSNPTDGHVH